LREVESISTINEIDDDRNAVRSKKIRWSCVLDEDQSFGETVLEVAQSKGLKAVIAANYLEIFDDINRFAPVALILDVKSKLLAIGK